MSLKAVLFDFNGVIINDEAIHQQLISDLLLSENLRPVVEEYKEVCLGRSDRACLRDILARRGRIVTEDILKKLIQQKATNYRQHLETLEELPLYSGLEEVMQKIQTLGLFIGVVTGALRSEVELVLNQTGLIDYFSVIVAGDDIDSSKPNPTGYLFAVELLNQQNSHLNLKPAECLAIEDTPAGIQAAKAAGMQVVGVANSYPFHMIQRQANWCVDYLPELELERVQEVFARV